MIRAAYATWVAGLTALWVALLAAPVLSARPETDLRWMMPLMETETRGRSGLGLLAFLFSPAPFLLGQPLLKLHLWLSTSAVGLSISALLVLSMGLHLLNAFLIYALSRAMGYSGRVGAVAGVVYLTLFAHFHAYLWPTAVQHLVAVSTILALLNFYLRIELDAARGEAVGPLYGAALSLMALSSIQRSALLGPLLMLIHTLWGSESALRRQESFRRWLPGWLLCGIYPSFALSAVGDPRMTRLFSQWSLPVFLKTLILWGVSVGVLFLIRRIVDLKEDARNWLLFFRRFAFLGVLGGVILWALRDKRQWVFLYNAVVPFTAMLTAFLEPLRTALLIPSTEPYHIIPPQVSVWSVGLSAALVTVFAVVTPARRKVLLVFGVWYAVGLLYFLQPYSSFPVHIPSRYFIYLSPIFAIMFSAVVSRTLEAGGRRLQIPPFWREAGLIGFVAALCIPNLIAIRLEMFRGRLANTYPFYEGLDRSGEDLFERSMREAHQAWDRGKMEEAKTLFRRAVETRPFFLRYVLSPYKLEDGRWLTGGMDLRQWVSKTSGLYISWEEELPDQAPGFRRVAAQLHRELSDYLFCHLALSYLEYRSGHLAESQRWLSRMGFLEQDGWRLSGWMQEDSRVKSDPGLAEFARRLGDPARFQDPLPWRKDDYGFGLFTMRLLTRW